MKKLVWGFILLLVLAGSVSAAEGSPFGRHRGHHHGGHGHRGGCR